MAQVSFAWYVELDVRKAWRGFLDLTETVLGPFKGTVGDVIQAGPDI